MTIALGTALWSGHTKRVARPILRLHNTGFTLVEDTAYFIYLGYVAELVTLKHVEFVVSAASAATQVCEVGFFSTPAPPNKASQTVTKLVATGTVDAMAVGGVRRNTNSFDHTLAAPVHLWAGIRSAFTGGGEPALYGVMQDWGEGHVLTTATAGALTDAGPWTGAVAAFVAATPCGPGLIGVMD